VVRGAGEAMTIILPEGKWAQRKWKIKYRTRRLYRRARSKIDWKYAAQSNGFVHGVKRKDLHRVTFTHNGKKHKMVVGKVKFEPFRTDITTPIDPKDAIYLRINPVEPE
jgi:hypothetical protein